MSAAGIQPTKWLKPEDTTKASQGSQEEEVAAQHHRRHRTTCPTPVTRPVARPHSTGTAQCRVPKGGTLGGLYMLDLNLLESYTVAGKQSGLSQLMCVLCAVCVRALFPALNAI